MIGNKIQNIFIFLYRNINFFSIDKNMISLLLLFVLAFLMIAVVVQFSSCKKKEKYSPVTGFSYTDGCNSMPVPANIKASSRSPPFYNLNSVRKPLCSYRNFTFPPPMNYTPIQETPAIVANKYLYWFNSAVLSHPQTAYLV